MHVDFWSLLIGLGLGILICAASGFGPSKKRPETSVDDPLVIYTRGVSQTLDDILKLMGSQPKLNEVIDLLSLIETTVHKIPDDNVQSVLRIEKLLTKDGTQPRDTHGEEVLGKILEPLKDALFRIAADTELSKKKFDVLAKLIGLDDKAAYANHIDRNEDEDNELVFNEMVVQEMKDQGLNWSQAVDTVKSRMAHRSRVR